MSFIVSILYILIINTFGYNYNDKNGIFYFNGYLIFFVKRKPRGSLYFPVVFAFKFGFNRGRIVRQLLGLLQALRILLRPPMSIFHDRF